jgi:uncharacterized protein (TIGR02246 family)
MLALLGDAAWQRWCASPHFYRDVHATQDNFRRWNDALKEKNYDKVAALYCSQDLSFLPTVSPKFIRDGQSTKEYFVEFLKKLPDGTITQDNVQRYGNDAYLHTGLYTFMTGSEGARQPVEARFSYMWRKVDGEWKISHHHSSALPSGQAAATAAAAAQEDPRPEAGTVHIGDEEPWWADGPTVPAAARASR